MPRALGELLTSSELWGPALIPALLLVLLAGGSGAFAVVTARPWLAERLPDATSSFGRVGVGVASWGFALFVAALGFYLALALAPVLSAPALERIVELVERRVGAPPRAPLGFFRELLCGLRALAGAACIALPISLVLWLAGMLIPGAVFVTLPLGALVSSLVVAWGLFDYPLTLRGIGFRARLRLLGRYQGCVFGFGAVFALLFWLPCLAVVLLPVGAIAATRLTCSILALERDSGSAMLAG